MTDERQDKPSASSMRRTRLCPGSVNLIRRLRREGLIGADDTEASREGTSRHSLIEMGVDAETIEDGNEAYTVRRAQQLLEEARIAARINGCDTYKVTEHRYWIYDADMNRVASAKVDHAETLGATGLVADYKTLFGDHGDAAKSEQITTQVVAFADTHGLEEVYAALIQPNLAKEKQLTVALYDRPAINRAQAEILAWCKAAEKEDAPRIPGSDQCFHCPARGKHCKESVAASLALTATDVALSLTPAQIEQFLDRIKMAESVISAVKERAKQMLADDPNVFGTYGLEPGKKVRSITDANAAFAVAEQFGVTVDEYRGVLTAPLGELSKLVSSRAEKDKGETKKKFEAALDAAGLIATKQNQSSLIKKK
jgi:hypothetical protein